MPPPIVMKLQSRQHRVATFPVMGDGYLSRIPYYYVKLSIGTPPRDYNLLVDTGSDVTWVSCEPCVGCPIYNQYGIPVSTYSISSSSSAMPMSCSDKFCPSNSKCSPLTPRCGFGFGYLDKSEAKGYYVRDVIHFGQPYSAASAIFGCGTNRTGGFASNDSVDGILGLGRQRYSIISQLSSRGVVPAIFSHCLTRDNGGILVLGEISQPGVTYTPLVSGSNYNLNLQSITIGGKTVHLNPEVLTETVIDSGTTLSFLAKEAYDPFNDFLAASVSRSAQSLFIGSDLCFEVHAMDRDPDIFPVISFDFEGGASMVVRPADYLILRFREDSGETWCSGFQKSPQSHLTVLGDFVLRDKIISYDLGNHRVGWTEFNCSQPMNISSNINTISPLWNSVISCIVTLVVYIL